MRTVWYIDACARYSSLRDPLQEGSQFRQSLGFLIMRARHPDHSKLPLGLAFVALWALLRAQRRFVAAFAAVGLFGLTLSVARYGIAPHIEYLDVLRFLTQHGESFWPNQSVNGLLHRWLGNGHNLTFYTPGSEFWLEHFPPYHPAVYLCTVASSILLLLAALRAPRRREERGGPLDLAFACIAATVAAPIAWTHHYGVLLPIFLIVYHAAHQRRLGNWFMAALAFCYLLAANLSSSTRQLAATAWNPLQSYVLFAALGLMVLVAMARERGVAESDG